MIDAATQEPTAYAQLAPAAKAILSNEPNAHSTIRVATSYGHTYAFYIDKVEGRQRVSWVDANTGQKDNALRKYRTMRAAVWRVTFSHPQPANSLTYRQ